jgi:hemerythrin
MAYFEWEDEFGIGVPRIDRQHMRLIEIINDLHDAMRERKGPETLRDLVDEMAVYAASHFSMEERLMLKHNYPRMRSHKLQHELFTQKVMDLQKRIEEKTLVLSLEVITFLRDWWATHILSSDRAMGAFLSLREVQ